MDELLKMYRPVEDFLKEIKITETWESNLDSTLLDGQDEVEIEQKVVLFNDLTFNEFVKKLDRNLSKISKKVKESTEQRINPKIINELKSLHQSWIDRLESKDYEVLKFTDEINQSTQELSDRLVNTITYLLNEHFKIYPNPKSNKKSSTNEKDVIPIRWNESINKLVDIFYQLSVELKNGEKRPLIETSPANLAKFIAVNFFDENGEPINIATVQTILKPSKIDKRPPFTKGVTIRYTPM